MNSCVNELKDLNIYVQLDKQLTSDPNAHHEIFTGLLNGTARAKHITRRRHKYEKKLNKKLKFITNRILNSINEKYKLYKTLIQTDTNNTVLHESLKAEFEDYRACLRKTIRTRNMIFILIHV